MVGELWVPHDKGSYLEGLRSISRMKHGARVWKGTPFFGLNLRGHARQLPRFWEAGARWGEASQTLVR